jgi:hypothetical protein
MHVSRVMLVCLALVTPVAATAQGLDPLNGSGNVSRSQLGTTYLVTTATDPGLLIDFAAYALPANAANPTNLFQGTLTLASPAATGGFKEIVDSFAYTNTKDSTRKHLPPFSFQFIQTGSHIFPLLRGSNASSHPEWEYVLAPGRVWNETADGGYSRASIPFTLQQKNENCMHNGALTFLFMSDGTVSKVAYQIASETCSYFKVNMWGILAATYAPQTILNAASLVSDYEAEVANRIPTKPMSALAADFPAAGIDVAKLLAPNGTDPNHITVAGFVTDGVHYTSGCTTRYGAYPFCSSLILPSYSTAKSAFGGLAMMRLEQKYPGTRSLPVKPYVPACNTTAWTGVSLEHTLDMATGNYKSFIYMIDEGAVGVSTFFDALTHAGKIDYSCKVYMRKLAPGTKWVYHTSDTYIAGTTMNAYLKSVEGPSKDVFKDIIAGELWAPLKTSPTSLYTRRTYDAVAQPFTGFGLMYMPDDVAKIASFVGVSHGAVKDAAGVDVQLLDTGLLDGALQRNPNDRGFDATAGYKYNNSFWAYNMKANFGCAADSYVPFMSGYGGISILLMQNDTVYYVFSDNNTFDWSDAAAQSNKIRSLCQ